MIHSASTQLPAWKKFLIQLKSRNRLLYGFTFISLIGAVIAGVLAFISEAEVDNFPAWLKPMRFFLSSAIMTGTLAWIMVYLQNQRAVRIYSKALVITLGIELLIISLQAARGRASHFNHQTVTDDALYAIMGISIVIFTLWTAWICWCFFRQKNFPLWMSEGYVWGIRLGLLFFVLFALQGGHMSWFDQHSIGGPDGSPGLPLTNFSTWNGDLRVPHFFGMHSLQILPLTGYYFFPKKTTLQVMALTWLLFVVLLYWQALKGFPLIP